MKTSPASLGWRHTGWVLLGLYVLLTVLCLLAAAVTDDPKGRFVLLQLPLALPLGGLVALGFGPLLADLSWWAAYGVIGVPTALGLYAVGWGFDVLTRALYRRWF
ncbi:hypothetical protein [Halothiobacillus sp. DCM-1]|uniref:hypothetical protein n=1 Tax=Halothiobacillus sp. DCM-1 TaxID=3112558 RepID=UPI0032497415